ncbi:MAG: hypothetical protein JSR66_05925 [Proteobacteria bacterium]|nr:hypothetical protein [Pseudomonadota bacterium]
MYTGVDFETATVPSNPTATSVATTSKAYITRVDLKAPGIAFIATPHSGSLQTTSETISQFAVDQRVWIAINANFFSPWCNPTAEPKNVIGLVRADKIGAPYVVNNPSGGAERFDAAAFGVYALPLLPLPFE